MKAPPSILLVDGNNLTLRALYGCADLRDREGFPTGCMMTTIRTISKVASEVRPLQTIFVWDAGRSKYREKLYPDYKKREPLEEDDPKLDKIEAWKAQVARLEDYLPLLGVGSVRVPGCEADDLIASLTSIFVDQGFKVFIATSDADFFQLVTPWVNVYNFTREKVMGEKEVHEEYGITPGDFVDYRAMIGDDSDNIKGVMGIGKKKAAAVINEFGSLKRFFRLCQNPGYLETRAKGKKYLLDLLESKSVISRNKSLMDLSALPEGEIPMDLLMEKVDLALSLEPKTKEFFAICKKHDLNILMQESYHWPALCGG